MSPTSCCGPMIRSLACLVLLLLAAGGCANRQPSAPKVYTKPLAVGESALVEVGIDTLPKFRMTPSERNAFKQGIEYSLAYLAKPTSAKAFLPAMGVTHEQVVRSLEELRKLIATANDDELDRAIRSRFRALMSVGCDNEGTVLFTGYYTPVLAASYTKDGPYQYPIYKCPPQLKDGGTHEKAHWQRRDGTLMECPDAAELAAGGYLKGHELAYLTDPWEVYAVRVNGSAKLRLPDGKEVIVGNAGTNGHDYKSIGLALIKDGKFTKDQLTFFSLRQYFHDHPDELQHYAATNPRFAFFKIVSRGPNGKLDQPVTADVSIAVNKHIFPPGSPVIVQTMVRDGVRVQPYCALRLDQDDGGAMRAPGRADLYMGVGDAAEQRAGVQAYEGRMWYLVLKN